MRAPRAVVCTISAAVVHDLTDVIPREVHAYARALGAETLVTTTLDVTTAR